jgi:hypothetical protein
MVFKRFETPKNFKEFISPQDVKKWVDCCYNKPFLEKLNRYFLSQTNPTDISLYKGLGYIIYNNILLNESDKNYDYDCFIKRLFSDKTYSATVKQIYFTELNKSKFNNITKKLKNFKTL